MPRALKPRAMAADSGDGMCSISECSIDGVQVDEDEDEDVWRSAASGMAMRASAGWEKRERMSNYAAH